jgi:chemotaxis protein methyltransferase CheR
VKARERLAARFESWFGLDLSRGGRLDALERVVTQRAASVAFDTPEAYVEALEGPDDPEVARLLDTTTVGHTWFFRDQEQVDAILGELRSSASPAAPAQVWVAGCSTGEDAYTVALLARSAGLSAEVLGTDINPVVLERARAARYAEWSLRQVPEVHAAYFVGKDGAKEVHADIVRTVRFERHNLVSAPPRPRGRTGWDIILCRNVLIYFRRSVAERVVEDLAGVLRPGGWLILGAAEVLQRPPPRTRIGTIGSRLGIQRLAFDPGPVPRSEGLAAAPRDPLPTPEAPVASGPLPPVVDAKIEQALALTEAGQNGEAIMLCARALTDDPLSAEAHLVSGIAYHLGNDPEAALRELRSSLLLAPELWPALFYLGQALEKLGRHDEAKEAYGQADLRARAAPSGRLGVLEAYKTEMATLARARARRKDAC